MITLGNNITTNLEDIFISGYGEIRTSPRYKKNSFNYLWTHTQQNTMIAINIEL